MENEDIKMTAVELEDLGLLDLDNENDLNVIEEELGSDSMFFKPDSNKTYKIVLTSSKTEFVNKTFLKNGEEETIKKIVLQIKALDRDKKEFIGIWECGIGTFRKIFKVIKDSKENAVNTSFKMTKTGSGLETRYDIVADDF